jgi:hypothetical protein
VRRTLALNGAIVAQRCDTSGLHGRKALNPKDRAVSGVTSTVAPWSHTGHAMETLDFDYTLFVTFLVLVSIGRIVRVLFATLKVCVKEYYEFRSWLRAVRKATRSHESRMNESRIDHDSRITNHE